MSRDPYRQDEIYKIIKAAPKPVSVADIRKKVPSSVQYINKLLGNLIQEGYIGRIPNGRRYLYTTTEKVPEFSKGPTGPRPSPQAILSMFEGWARNKWEPKVFNSAELLPLGLAALYEECVSIMKGNKPDQYSIDRARLGLVQFSRDLNNTLLIVNALLDTRDLWSTQTIHQGLEVTDPNYIESLIEIVRKYYE